MDPFIVNVCMYQLARPKRRIKIDGVGNCATCTSCLDNMACTLFKPVSVINEVGNKRLLYRGRYSGKLRELKRRRNYERPDESEG